MSPTIKGVGGKPKERMYIEVFESGACVAFYPDSDNPELADKPGLKKIAKELGFKNCEELQKQLDLNPGKEFKY